MGGFQAGVFGRISQTYVSIVLLFFCRASERGCGFFYALSRQRQNLQGGFSDPLCPDPIVDHSPLAQGRECSGDEFPNGHFGRGRVEKVYVGAGIEREVKGHESLFPVLPYGFQHGNRRRFEQDVTRVGGHHHRVQGQCFALGQGSECRYVAPSEDFPQAFHVLSGLGKPRRGIRMPFHQGVSGGAGYAFGSVFDQQDGVPQVPEYGVDVRLGEWYGVQVGRGGYRGAFPPQDDTGINASGGTSRPQPGVKRYPPQEVLLRQGSGAGIFKIHQAGGQGSQSRSRRSNARGMRETVGSMQHEGIVAQIGCVGGDPVEELLDLGTNPGAGCPSS